MDTVTQAALGASIALAGWRSLGLRGMAFGAICGLLPDLDVVLSVGDPWRGMLTHRGASHSLLVLPWVAVPVGWLAWVSLGRGEGAWTRWAWLALWGLVTHPLLDVFTSYGTQLLAPFSRHRFAFDGVAIVDPIATLPLLAAVALGLRGRGERFARAALGWMVVYIGLGAAMTRVALHQAEGMLAAEGFEPVALRAPIPILFTPLRRITARDATGELRVGMHAIWAPERTRLLSVAPPDQPQIQAALQTEQGKLLVWFSDGFLSVDEGDGLVLLDARYGLFSDARWTPFRARLVGGELQVMDRRQPMDGKAEWRAGLELMFGP